MYFFSMHLIKVLEFDMISASWMPCTAVFRMGEGEAGVGPEWKCANMLGERVDGEKIPL